MAKRTAGRRTEGPNGAISEERIWRQEPDTVRQFLQRRTEYEQLCAEVAYIMEKHVKEAGIEFASVTRRAKTLKSFIEKLGRKQYGKPFDEITDFAGVRVTHLYRRDQDDIERLIRQEFEIVEIVDKLEEQGPDRFGYGAIHYIIKLGPKSSGARYDDLKHLVCELQVRTVLQDAWAIIDHHLVYKEKASVPKTLQRRLNSLVGLFEVADDQFDRLRQDRKDYVLDVEAKKEGEDFLAQEVNFDTMKAYAEWKFPALPVDKGNVGLIVDLLHESRFPDLQAIDDVYEEHKDMIDLDAAKSISGILYVNADDYVDMALLLADSSYWKGGQGMATALRRFVEENGG